MWRGSGHEPTLPRRRINRRVRLGTHAFVFDDDGHVFIDCEKDGTLRAVLVGMQHQAEGALPVT